MKKIKIGVVCNSRSVVETVKKVAAQKGLDVDWGYAGLDAAISVARRMERDGAEAILSRGGTIRLIRENVRIPVLSFPRSATDIMMNIKETEGCGKNILYISFLEKISGLDIVEDMLGCHITQVVCQDLADLDRVLSTCQGRYDIVIGGSNTVNTARRYGLNAVESKTSDEVIVSSIDNAISAVCANREEQKKAVNFRCIIDSISEGVISFDLNGNMTNINNAAKTLLKISDDEDIRDKVGYIFRKSSLRQALQMQRPVLDRIEDLNDEKSVFSHIPIVLNGENTGCVTTIKAISNVIRVESEVRKSLSKGFTAKYTFRDLIHKSRAMNELINRARHFASSQSTILIIGETGTGKEILTQSIHACSSRSKSPFVSINCAALSESLLQSELFGYEEGSFTGSKKGGKPGLFEISHTGTIFLDEIASTSQQVQRHLLRVIQEKEVMRIGADRIVPVDVRIIAASNNNIENEVYGGKFREDLFFRLNILRLKVPALRERQEDIPLLLEHFLSRLAQEDRTPPLQIPNKFLVKLQKYQWPGNVRQLRNFAERLYLLCGRTFSPTLFDELYSELIEYLPNCIDRKKASPGPTEQNETNSFRQDGDVAHVIRKAIETSNYSKSAAARKLGISRTTLWKRLKDIDENRA
jgi:transcriptional regulator, propionate catabolism operon regulatory protein